MKQTCGIALALMLTLPLVVSASVILPEYKNMKPDVSVVCDNGATILNQYEIDTVGILVVITTKHYTIYNLVNDANNLFLYQAGGGDIVETTKEKTDAIIKEYAPNFYNAISHTDKSDCKEV